MSNNHELIENIANIGDLSKFPMLMGVVVYGMGVLPILLPIKNSMVK